MGKRARKMNLHIKIKACNGVTLGHTWWARSSRSTLPLKKAQRSESGKTSKANSERYKLRVAWKKTTLLKSEKLQQEALDMLSQDQASEDSHNPKCRSIAALKMAEGAGHDGAHYVRETTDSEFTLSTVGDRLLQFQPRPVVP